MKIEIIVSDDKKAYSIKIDGSEPVPMDNFLLLTQEGDKSRNLVFGNVEEVGRLLYGFYVNCWRLEETGMRDVLELVAEDIRDGKDLREQASDETIRRLM
jgi:hypothetical protein